MDIKSLPQDVQDYLRSGANIKSISQCIMELVLNSLDAKSTAVAVRVNLLTFRIQVVDNGIGVTQSNMGVIGLQHMTSKCQSITDLNKIRHFGFRGEALASISKMSKKVSIISRPKDVENTYSKTYENGKWSKTEIVKLRAGQGTTVTVTEFMHNFPVRQKRVNKNFDLDETKKNMIALAIINPKITFSLRNDSTGKVILQSRRAHNVTQAIFNFYPEILVEEFAELKVSKNKINVAGLIYKQSHNNGALQYIFLNKRPIVSQKIQKLLNSSLEKICSKNEHPVYCLNISCPYTQVDLTLSPSKTTVEFKNWDIILKCIEKGIHIVLKDNNLAISTTQHFPITSGKRASLNSQFGLTQVEGVIIGKRVKRNDPSSEIPLACSDPLPNMELDNKEQLTSIDNKSNKQDEYPITQNLVKDGATQAHNTYCSTLTNSLNNQEKGKSLILNMFLKSTVAFPINKSLKTNTLIKEKRRDISNTLTMTLYTKRTIMRNSHFVQNQKNTKMISKCVQTTRIQQEDTINVNFVPNYCPAIPRPHFSNNEQVKKVSYLNDNFFNFRTLNRYQHNFSTRQNCAFPPSLTTVIPKYQSYNPISEYYANNLPKLPMPNLPTVHNMYSPYFTRDPPTSHQVQDIIYPSFKRTFPQKKADIKRNYFHTYSPYFARDPPTSHEVQEIIYPSFKKTFPQKKADIRRKYFDCINFNTIPNLFGGTKYTTTKSKKTNTRRERKRQINTIRKNELKHASRDFEENRIGNKRAPRKMQGTFLRSPNKLFPNIFNYNNFCTTIDKLEPKQCEMSHFQQIGDTVRLKDVTQNCKRFKKAMKEYKHFPFKIHNEQLESVLPTFQTFISHHNKIKSPIKKNFEPNLNTDKFVDLFESNSIVTGTAPNFCYDPTILCSSVMKGRDEPSNNFFVKRHIGRSSYVSPEANQIFDPPISRRVGENELPQAKRQVSSFLSTALLNTVSANPLICNQSVTKPFSLQNHSIPRPTITEDKRVAQDDKSEKKFDINKQIDMISNPEVTETFCVPHTTTMEGELRTKEDNCDHKLYVNKQAGKTSIFSPKLNKTFDVMIPENEWMQQEDKSGNKFFINKRTGMTSIFSPKVTESFNVMKRMNFVPKGSSPMLYQTKKFDKSLSPNSKKILHKALIKCHEDELSTIKWSNYIHDGIGVTQFFDQLYDEKCKQFDTAIQNVSVSAFSRSMIKTCNHLQTQYFTKDIFMDITIVGQLDRKFIVTFCKSKELIILFDQHAVSERVRLENLLKDYKEKDQFKTTKCNNVIIDVFPSRDLIILANYKKYFEALGLFYKIGYNTLEITHVPSCICSKFEKDEEFSLKKLIIPLINEQIDTILSTRGASLRMPAVIQNVINMEACRGAIKFGKFLSMQETETLIKNLSMCQLPFQCAHGRPTLSPIINLQQNTVQDYILKPPNLRKLKQY